MSTKNIWEEFEGKIDVEGLKKELEEVEKNGGGNFKKVPLGTYEVEVNKMELTKSKKGDPMLTIWFKIVTGDYKGSLIFYNQVISTGYGLHNANEILRDLDSGIEVKFVNLKQYHEMLLDIIEAVTDNLEYALKLDKNAKDYNTYEIVDVFEK